MNIKIEQVEIERPKLLLGHMPPNVWCKISSTLIEDNDSMFCRCNDEEYIIESTSDGRMNILFYNDFEDEEVSEVIGKITIIGD